MNARVDVDIERKKENRGIVKEKREKRKGDR